MNKKLDENKITNELKGASAFFQKSGQSADLPADEQLEPAGDQLTGQLTSQSIDQPASRSTSAPADIPPNISPILGRPKAFYLTEKQDQELDAAVTKLSERLQGRVEQKIDRSTVIRLLLESSDITSEQTIQRLAEQQIQQLLSQLTRQSTKQSTSQPTG
jgi:hypothetical protein